MYVYGLKLCFSYRPSADKSLTIPMTATIWWSASGLPVQPVEQLGNICVITLFEARPIARPASPSRESALMLLL